MWSYIFPCHSALDKGLLINDCRQFYYGMFYTANCLHFSSTNVKICRLDSWLRVCHQIKAFQGFSGTNFLRSWPWPIHSISGDNNLPPFQFCRTETALKPEKLYKCLAQNCSFKMKQRKQVIPKGIIGDTLSV